MHTSHPFSTPRCSQMAEDGEGGIVEMLGISISGDKDQSWMVNMKISRAEWYGTLGGEEKERAKITLQCPEEKRFAEKHCVLVLCGGARSSKLAPKVVWLCLWRHLSRVGKIWL